MKEEIDNKIQEVLYDTNFISGRQVQELENQLAQYVGTKFCISCANGTDALTLALMAWDIGKKDAVFVPDFTFFASAETVAFNGATPILVDVDKKTYNIDVDKLEEAIKKVLREGNYRPKVILAVDLFGQPADYERIRAIAENYQLLILEDGAQGFGGAIGNQRACSFGDISTTSFFPAKPLGAYGDGGAIFLNNEEWVRKIKSFKNHGQGNNKYDNVYIGLNSRLDTIQAAILQVKLKKFKDWELYRVNEIAKLYTDILEKIVETPEVKKGFFSSWAQYVIKLESQEQREKIQSDLKKRGIPTMVYYPKPLHMQKGLSMYSHDVDNLKVSSDLSKRVLALPIHPYLKDEEVEKVGMTIKERMEA